ncbi:RES family NAD+ phosphorylase [Hydrogenophaga soli]
MRRRNRKPTPPAPRGAAAGAPPVKGILELDRFSEESLERWSELSADLDELQDILYFNLEPERRRRRPELLKALQETPAQPLELENWVRIVDYQWTLYPLSAAGSLTSIGGRFNAGTEIDSQTFSPWPCLYLASDHATAYREKFQIEAGQMVEGLRPEELALTPGQSHTTVVLNGKLSRVFTLTPATLGPVARVLGKIRMPERAERIKKRLKINPNDLRMLTTGKQLHDAAAVHNWRVLPVQFGLPAPSQILSELIRAADFEAIAYQSSKSGGTCLAIFVDRLAPGSYVELSGTPPAGATVRLDETTAEELAGWAQLGIKPPKV